MGNQKLFPPSSKTNFSTRFHKWWPSRQKLVATDHSCLCFEGCSYLQRFWKLLEPLKIVYYQLIFGHYFQLLLPYRDFELTMQSCWWIFIVWLKARCTLLGKVETTSSIQKDSFVSDKVEGRNWKICQKKLWLNGLNVLERSWVEFTGILLLR